MTQVICKVLAERLYATEHDLFHATNVYRYIKLQHICVGQKGRRASLSFGTCRSVFGH